MMRKESGVESAAVILLIPEAKCPELNMSTDFLFLLLPLISVWELLSASNCDCFVHLSFINFF